MENNNDDDDGKQPNVNANGESPAKLERDDEAELSRPGAVSVATAAPQGKSGRLVTKVSTPLPLRSEDDTSSHVDALSSPKSFAAKPESVRPTPTNQGDDDAKAAIRQEMKALRSGGGSVTTPGAMSVVGGSVSVTPVEVPPVPSSSLSMSSTSTKAAIKQEMEALRNNPELNRPGAHSIVSTSSIVEKGGASRAERPSRRIMKGNDVEEKIRSSNTVGASTTSATTIANKHLVSMADKKDEKQLSKPGAIPSTAESTAATEKALMLKTGDAEKVGAVQSTAAADEKNKMMKVDAPSSGSTFHQGSNTKEVKKLVDASCEVQDEKSKTVTVQAQTDAPADATISATTQNDSEEFTRAESSYMMDDGLVAAQVIDEDALEAQYQAKMMKQVVAAQIVSEDELKERGRRWKMACCCLFIVAVVLSIAIPLSKENAIEASPTAAPTEQTEYDYLYDLFRPYSGSALDDNSTAQYRALQWIAFDDPMELPIKSTNETTLVERYAAVVFYYATGGEEWTRDFGFLSNTSICEWRDDVFGVFCDEEENVSARLLEFNNNNLNGTIPTELLGFSRLHTLSITYGLQGTLPSELGDMTALTLLQLPGNNITGTIPESLARLRLSILNLNLNQLTGTVPEDMFTHSIGMQYLVLSQNQIGGTLPEIKRQSSIIYLMLDENQFEGTIPQSYFEQQNLVLLGLSDNFLTGSIPEQIRAIESLTYFYAQKNNFDGTIPVSLGELRDMEELYLSDNQFTGPIPTEFGKFDLLAKLSLSRNRLTGTLPSEIGDLSTLITFDAASTGLSGTVPLSYSQLTSLTQFDLSDTNVVDGLEQAFCAQPNLATSIKADCLGDNATVSCDCCTSCCGESGCELNLVSQCETRSAEFSSASDRGTVCECQDGGATMSCNDTACESCNLDGSVCVQSTDYGFSFDETTGQIISFRNVLQYTKGRNDTVVFSKDANQEFCNVEVNGQKCNYCGVEVCQSTNQGFRVDCSNVNGGPLVQTCAAVRDVEYLQAFFLTDLSAVSGCVPVLINLLPYEDS